MAKDYFHRVAAETETRVWVNNPSLSDLRNAIDAGAINGTTNPAYGSKLLKTEHDYMVGVIQSVVSDFSDDHEAAVIEELREKIPDFRRAYDDDGLAPQEFAHFAPLLRFRNNFIDGCDAVLREVAKYRRAIASA